MAKVEEERRISPAIIIISLALGLAAVAGLALAAAAKAAPPVFTCPYCGAEFGTEEELLAHIQLEHPEVPLVATLYGVVTDAETGYALQGVKVTLDSLVAYTDSSGYYSFANLNPGTYSVKFEKDGYETVVR